MSDSKKLMRNITVQIVFLISVGFLPSTIYAKTAKDTKDLCLECHPKFVDSIKKTQVHQPVREGKCTQCHNPHASKHRGLLGYIGGDLCYNCHDLKKGFIDKVVHKPVEEGNCLVCHDAHASNTKGLVKKMGGEGCFSCHPKETIVSKKIIHPEVRRGNCLACHNPHASEKDGLLVKDKKALCIGCHKDAGGALAKAHRGYPVSGSDCLSCHSPHASDRKGILKASLHKPFEENKCTACHAAANRGLIRTGISLCTECHKASMSGFNKINSHLIAGKNDTPCGNCHTPHASDAKNLLKDKEERVCYSCHFDTKESVAGSNHTHPKLGACLDCHTSHGSNFPFFLAKGNDTCSVQTCHATQGRFTHPVGEKVIDPRSKTPMSCNTCHNPMGSPESFILRFEKDRELCVQCHQV